MATFNIYKFTQNVYAHIGATGTIRRSDLNSYFKATSDLKMGDHLNNALKSLLHFGHIYKYFEESDNTVWFWQSTFTASPYTADPTPVRNPPDEDFLQGAPAAPLPPAPPAAPTLVTLPPPKVSPPPVPKVTAPAPAPAPKPSLTSPPPASLDKYRVKNSPSYSEELWQLALNRAKTTTTDTLAAYLSGLFEHFTLVDMCELKPDAGLRAVSMRLSLVCSKGALNMGTYLGTKVFWSAEEPTPEGVTPVHFSSTPKLKEPKVVDYIPKAAPKVTAVQADLEELEGVKDTDTLPTQESTVSFTTGQGFTLCLDGTVLPLSKKHSALVLRAAAQLNLDKALSSLEQDD